jgi:hypothetical protein
MEEDSMKIFSTLLVVCFSVSGISAFAASDHTTMPTSTLEEQAPPALHALDGLSPEERHSAIPLSDMELATIEGQGTINIGLAVLGKGIIIDHFITNPGAANVINIGSVPKSTL